MLIGGYIIADFTNVKFASSENTGVANNVPKQVMDALIQKDKTVFIQNIKLTIAGEETTVSGFATRIEVAVGSIYVVGKELEISITGANQITANF